VRRLDGALVLAFLTATTAKAKRRQAAALQNKKAKIESDAPARQFIFAS